MARKTGKTTQAYIYTFKVGLLYQKTIWRRISIRSDQTLDDLHGAIYCAFDRYDEHLYSFYIPPPGCKGTFRSRIRAADEHTSLCGG